jgi:hypothetical protein
MDALTSRSETGSETEQVGSGMNGRRGVERGFRTPGECVIGLLSHPMKLSVMRC